MNYWISINLETTAIGLTSCDTNFRVISMTVIYLRIGTLEAKKCMCVPKYYHLFGNVIENLQRAYTVSRWCCVEIKDDENFWYQIKSNQINKNRTSDGESLSYNYGYQWNRGQTLIHDRYE